MSTLSSVGYFASRSFADAVPAAEGSAKLVTNPTRLCAASVHQERYETLPACTDAVVLNMKQTSNFREHVPRVYGCVWQLHVLGPSSVLNNPNTALYAAPRTRRN